MSSKTAAIKSAHSVVQIVVCMAVLSAIIAFLLPRPEHWHSGRLFFYLPLALSLAFVWLHVGAVVIFLSNLSDYKLQLRRSYGFICVCITLLALGAVQLPVLTLLDAWGSVWVTTGYVALPFLLGGLAGYLGVRRLSLLVGNRGLLTKVGTVVPAIIVLCGISTLLPHVKSPTAEVSYDIALAILVWSAASYGAAAWLLAQVRARIGAHYVETMAWLLTGFAAMVVALLLATGGNLLSKNIQDGWNIAIDTCGLIAGILLLRAGLAFAKAKDY